MSSWDSSYEIGDGSITIEGQKFGVKGVTVWDTPDYISHSIILTRPEWEEAGTGLTLRTRSKTLRWSERNQCFAGGIDSVRDLDSLDISDMLPIDHEKLIRGLTIKKIQAMYKKEHEEDWNVQNVLFPESSSKMLDILTDTIDP